MKNRRKGMVFILLSLLLASSLSACKSSDKKAEDTKVIEEKQKETILMAVGEEEVSMEEAKVYAYFLKHQYEKSIGDVIWSYKLDGKDFETYAKKEMQSLLTQIKITKQEAKKQGIELIEDEIEEARSYALDYLAGAEEADKEAYGLTESILTQIYGENILANKVFEISTNDVDTNISDDEVKQITIQYLMVMTKGTDLNGVLVDMNQEEKKQAKIKAKKLLKEAKEVTDFAEFARVNTDVKEVEQTFSKIDAPKGLEEISFQLKSGEFSSLAEAEDGYYIIYCVNDDNEDATAQRKEELIRERQMASFEEKFTQWSTNYGIVVSTTLWDKIKF